MEFTRLSDVTLIEEAKNEFNVLIEDNGEIKRVSKSEVGGVKTVNNTAPDSNGNINVEFDGVKSPATAKVGQTILVKSVDGSGKPTDWECADMPTGGGGEEVDMIISISDNCGVAIIADTFSIIEGSMDNVFNKVRAGQYPLVKIKFNKNTNDAYMPIREEYRAQVLIYGESLWIKAITVKSESAGYEIYIHSIYLNSDGTFSSSDIRKITSTTV